MNIQGWIPLGLTSWISLLSKGLSRVFSSTTIQKHQFFSVQPYLWSHFYVRVSSKKKKKTNKKTQQAFQEWLLSPNQSSLLCVKVVWLCSTATSHRATVGLLKLPDLHSSATPKWLHAVCAVSVSWRPPPYSVVRAQSSWGWGGPAPLPQTPPFLVCVLWSDVGKESDTIERLNWTELRLWTIGVLGCLSFKDKGVT